MRSIAWPATMCFQASRSIQLWDNVLSESELHGTACAELTIDAPASTANETACICVVVYQHDADGAELTRVDRSYNPRCHGAGVGLETEPGLIRGVEVREARKMRLIANRTRS